ncbi:hypothetical protein [Chachezhania antarctica]|uniref:hypothetical protein n=1 Tax=Chachezhania antarctica TaxID=2340860 RepID=UPI0013CEA61C|nr:hypothetical protein [Chachezhania antarctica]
MLATVAGQAGADDTGGYVPYSGIVRGTEGVTPVELVIENAGPGPILCQASLAHWYSDDLGEAPAAGVLSVTLWHDPETGSLVLLNAHRDRMPVEAVTCRAPDATRWTRLALPFAAGEGPARIVRRCATGADAALVCGPVD